MKRVGQIYRDKLASTARIGMETKANVFVVNYSKLTSFQLSEIRKSLRQAGADVYATKNTLARKVLKDLNQIELANSLNNQTAFVWSDGDSAAVSKVLKKYVTDHATFAVSGGVVEGRYVNAGDVKKLADLPPREVLLAQLHNLKALNLSQNKMNMLPRGIPSSLNVINASPP